MVGIFLRAGAHRGAASMIFCLAVPLIMCEGIHCIGQQDSPATPTPIPQTFKSKSEAKRAANADYAEGERLRKEQKVDSLRNAGQRYQAAAREFQEAGERGRQAGALGFCGLVADALGQKQEALQYYGQELTIWQDLGNSSRQAQSLTDIGNLYDDLGRRQEALEYYQQALKIQRQVGDRRGEGASLFFIGSVYHALGEKQDALKSYEQALAISHELEGRTSAQVPPSISPDDRARRALELASLNNIAELHRELGQKEEALKSFMQVLPIARVLGSREAEATTLNNIGGVHDDFGQKQDALEYYRQALSIYHEIGDPSGEATTLNNIGESYYRLGQQREALNYYAQALPIFRKLGDRASEAVQVGNIAMVFYDAFQKQEASRYDHRDAYSDLAMVFVKQQVQIYETLRRDISTLSQDTQHSFARRGRAAYQFLASRLLDKGRLAEAQQILDLLKQQEYAAFTGSTRSDRRSSVEIMTIDDLDTLKKLIGDSANGQGKDELVEEGLKTARIALPEVFAADGGLVSSAFGPRVQVNDLQRQLPTGTVMLYCQSWGKAHYTLLVTPGALKVRIYELGAEDFDKNVREFRRVLLDPSTDPKPAALAIYKIIIGDLQKDLDAAEARKLLWSLDDKLRYVPMQALYDGSHYLAERYSNVLYTQVAAGKKVSGGELKVWAGGMSQSREGLPALPGVRSELLAIVRSPGAKEGVIPGLMVTDEAFTAGALRSGLKQKYPLVHIASHFVLRPGNEDDSFLLLGDGRLSLSDLRKSADYDMTGVELLTLSACDTGFGDGREIEGLATTAQLRGARSVMASLWEVNDPSTSAFMQRFYTELSGDSRIGKAGAFQHAELALLHGETGISGAQRGFKTESGTQTPEAPRNYSHPFYWAPFILMGDWN